MLRFVVVLSLLLATAVAGSSLTVCTCYIDPQTNQMTVRLGKDQVNGAKNDILGAKIEHCQLTGPIFSLEIFGSVAYRILLRSGVAWGTFDDYIMTTGYGILNTETNKAFLDSQQMSCAGFLEGTLFSSSHENIDIRAASYNNLFSGVNYLHD
jgi:hypothetical protein